MCLSWRTPREATGRLYRFGCPWRGCLALWRGQRPGAKTKVFSCLHFPSWGEKESLQLPTLLTRQLTVLRHRVIKQNLSLSLYDTSQGEERRPILIKPERFYKHLCTEENGFVTATKLGTTKCLLLQPNILPLQPNVLLIEPNILFCNKIFLYPYFNKWFFFVIAKPFFRVAPQVNVSGCEVEAGLPRITSYRIIFFNMDLAIVVSKERAGARAFS